MEEENGKLSRWLVVGLIAVFFCVPVAYLVYQLFSDAIHQHAAEMKHLKAHVEQSKN